MSKDRIFVGLDVGSAKVRTVIGAKGEDGESMQIIGVAVVDNGGMRKGAVTDVEEVVSAISKSVAEAERMAGTPVDHAVVSVSGANINSFNTRGFISIGRSDGEITVEDTERALEAAQAVSMPPNQQVLQIVPRSYTVDDQKGIRDPVSMTGIRLEVDAHIITGSVQNLKNITKCVHQTGIDIDEFVPSMLAVAEAVLSKRQRELGVAVIDIGGGCVNMGVFEEGNVIHTACIPIGAAHITNDVAIGLRTSIDTAEKIKVEYGSCLPGEIRDRENIDLSTISNVDSQVISRRQLSQIIEARLQEIFAFVNEELSKIKRDGLLPAGAVITGGGAKTPGIVDLAKESLGLPVQIGFPMEMEGVVDRIDDPAYATALGLLLWSSKHDASRYIFRKGGFLVGIKDWFKSFVS